MLVPGRERAAARLADTDRRLAASGTQRSSTRPPGAVLYRRSLVNHASGLVFDNYPGAPAGGDADARRRIDAWLAAGGATTLTGNNAHAWTRRQRRQRRAGVEEVPPTDRQLELRVHVVQLDPAGGVRLHAAVPVRVGPGSVGAFSWHDEPPAERDAGVLLRQQVPRPPAAPPIGFTEAAGNFQLRTRAARARRRSGADARDRRREHALLRRRLAVGLPDGPHRQREHAHAARRSSPRMQMFLFDDPAVPAIRRRPVHPGQRRRRRRTSSTTSTRTACPTGSSSTRSGNSTLGGVQAGAMGEAWSDWYAMRLPRRRGLRDRHGRARRVRDRQVRRRRSRPHPLPADGLPGRPTAAGLPRRRRHRHRRLHLRRLRQASSAVPRCTPTARSGPQTLWDLRDAIGVATAASLVTRAMELSPANPSFLDMRNSILQADRRRTAARTATRSGTSSPRAAWATSPARSTATTPRRSRTSRCRRARRPRRRSCRARHRRRHRRADQGRGGRIRRPRLRLPGRLRRRDERRRPLQDQEGLRRHVSRRSWRPVPGYRPGGRAGHDRPGREHAGTSRCAATGRQSSGGGAIDGLQRARLLVVRLRPDRRDRPVARDRLGQRHGRRDDRPASRRRSSSSCKLPERSTSARSRSTRRTRAATRAARRPAASGSRRRPTARRSARCRRACSTPETAPS